MKITVNIENYEDFEYETGTRKIGGPRIKLSKPKNYSPRKESHRAKGGHSKRVAA